MHVSETVSKVADSVEVRSYFSDLHIMSTCQCKLHDFSYMILEILGPFSGKPEKL